MTKAAKSKKKVSTKKTKTTNTGVGSVRHDFSLFSEQDSYLFKEGSHFRLYQHLGSHYVEHDGEEGVYFAVMAPSASKVTVIGDFNGWNNESHALSVRWDESGIWEGFIPGVQKGDLYKFHVVSNKGNFSVDKRDPFAQYCEIPPKTSSIVWETDRYQWEDQDWMKKRSQKNKLSSPMSIYEVHFGSFKRKVEDGHRSLTYREMASELIPYVKEMGFTHVEFLPLMAFPFEGSWGYQSVGYFAPTSRYGSPEDLMYLIDQLHQNDIGVILDWVPSHFPSDEHGLAYFDGTHLFEHEDPRQGFHPDWKSFIYNYERRETLNFLISSALFWLDKFHIDGLRVDGVASMLYLDYSRNDGEWIPNKYGGRENLGALEFLKRLNTTVYQEYPDVQMIAEESTAWPGVSRPTYLGGLGFGLKWNMGWMHDTLEYFQKDPIYRKYHQHDLTFSLIYAFTENFLLSLSHDEVVHGKGSLLRKMPGDDWQKFANLRALYAFMFTHPGKKLLFMGQEIGQWDEWNHDRSVDWHLLDYGPHRGLQSCVKDLNKLYQKEEALHQSDFSPEGFEWIDNTDAESSVLVYARKSSRNDPSVVIVCNFTPALREGYRIGMPAEGKWKEIFNSDAKEYGGSDQRNQQPLETESFGWHGKDHSLSLKIPPLGVVVLKQD